MDKFEKINERHDDVGVLGRVIYGNMSDSKLYVDPEFTEGVTTKELEDLFYRGVFVSGIVDGSVFVTKPSVIIKNAGVVYIPDIGNTSGGYIQAFAVDSPVYSEYFPDTEG